MPQVVPRQGVHAYLVTAHATGHNKGRVTRLNTITGAVDPRAFATSKPRALAVSISPIRNNMHLQRAVTSSSG